MKKQPAPKPGRPPMKLAERKGKLIAFRVEPDVGDAFDRAAKKSAKKLSEWIRDTLLAAVNASQKTS